MSDSTRQEIDMIKARLIELINQVNDVKATFEKAFIELKKELESEVRGQWSWKKEEKHE